jgi:nucleoside-diphosphate-sugar epimerase
MVSDGTPWRPLVHVLDICKAARCALEADRGVIHGETFNVGDSNENYQIQDGRLDREPDLPGMWPLDR